MYRTNVLDITFTGFAWMMVSMLSTLCATYTVLQWIGYDPAWSMTKTSLACAKIVWKDLERYKLVENAIRASGFLTGELISAQAVTTHYTMYIHSFMGST